MEQDPILGDGTANTAPMDANSTAIDQIKEKLSNEGQAEAPKSSLPPELLNLTQDQIREFKRILEVTPDLPDSGKPKAQLIRLREIDGKIVVDFKERTHYKRVRDENDKEVERLFIGIRFFGTTEWADYPFKDFINSKQIWCEVLKTDTQTEDKIVGETVSRETGKLVNMVHKLVKTCYTLKLPSGETLEIDGRIANG